VTSIALVLALLPPANAGIKSQTPRAAQTCLGSPGRVGTDNVPFTSNGYWTSIIDIWGFASDSGPASVWLYETTERKFWLQRARHAPPFQVQSKDAAIAEMRREGLHLVSCFSRPFVMRQ
jgi:hypothetical protein